MVSGLSQVRRLRVPPREVVEVLKDIVRGAGARTSLVGGRIGFKIHGVGCWSLDLSVNGGRWTSDITEPEFLSCDTRIFSFASDFAALLIAPSAIEGLLATGGFAVEGDRTRLSKLAKMIRAGEGGSLLSVRASM